MSSYEQMLVMLHGDEAFVVERYTLLREKLVMYIEGRRMSTDRFVEHEC